MICSANFYKAYLGYLGIEDAALEFGLASSDIFDAYKGKFFSEGTIS